jgi:dipeptidyl aminopeptidase/acylaminoacyl peptidase
MIDRGGLMRSWMLLSLLLLVLSACQTESPVSPTKLPNAGSVGIVLRPTKTTTITLTSSAIASTRTPASTPTPIPPVAVTTLSPQFWLDAGVSPDTILASMTGNMFEPIGQIGTARVDGTTFQPLTTDKYNWLPLLSPDRQRIVYQSLPHSATPSAEALSSWRNSPSEVWVTTVDGQEKWQLTDSKARRDQLVWSPDSQRVAFVEGPNSLLVESEVNNQARHEATSGAVRPRYRPDGRGIGYMTTDGGLSWYEDGVTHTIVPTSTLLPNTSIHDFDWLPDGQHVVYTLMDKSHQEHPGVPFGIEYSVWVTPIDQVAPTKIADDVHDLEVAPSGRYISALRGTGYGDVCVIDWHPVFLLLAPDLKSAQLISAENRAALPPEEQHNVFTDLYRVSWINDHVAKVTIFTCVDINNGEDHRVKTHTYLVDLNKQAMVEVGSENPW